MIFRRFSGFNDIALSLLKKFDKFDASKYDSKIPTTQFGLDSLDTVEFVIALEDELKIELTDEEALVITTVDEAFSTFQKYKQIN